MKNTLFKTRPASIPTAITVAVSILAMAIAIPATGADSSPEGPGIPEGKDMQEYTDRQESISKDTLRQSTITGTARISFLNEGRTVPATKVYMRRIESERIMNYKDLSATVPNLFIPEYGSKMTSSIYIRGLGTRIDNPVMGLYVDGIGYFNKNDFDMEFFDIRSVEVFRGPQGTLFGRNTTGGIIDITTLSPLSYQGTRASVGYGNGNSLEAKLSHYAKLSDNFGIGAGGYYRHSDGFYENEYVRTHPQWLQEYGSGAWADPALCDWSDEAGGRIRAEWKADDRAEFDNTLTAGWLRQGGFPYKMPGQAINYNGYCGYERLNITEGLSYRFRLGGLSLSGTTSYRYGKDRMDMDQDYLPLSYFTLVQAQREHSASQELVLKRSTSPETGWDWISGISLFYKHNVMSAPVTFLKDGIDGLILGAANAGIGSVFPGHSIKIEQDSFVMESDFTTRSSGAALYHTSYYKTGKWIFEAGLRIDYEHIGFDYASGTGIDYMFTLTMDDFRHLESRLDGRNALDYIEVLPRLAIQYGTEARNLYLAVSKGYKAGGFNTQLFSDILRNKLSSDMMAGLGMPSGDGTQDIAGLITYKPEKCWNFEIGASGSFEYGKSVFRGGVTAFLVETIDQQLTVFPEKGTGRMMTNAGRSRSMGIEASFNYRYGELSINIDYGFTDARFVRYDDGQNDYSGKYVPYIPANTLSASAFYSLKTGKNFLKSIDFNVNTKAFGEIRWNEENSLVQPFYALLNASIELIFKGFSVELWGKNLTSTNYATFYFESVGNAFLQEGLPARYGISMKLEL